MEIPKGWSLAMAEIEGDAKIGAGFLAADPNVLDKICLICGEPIGKHIIGGPGYHPGTIKPDAVGPTGKD